jgi:hypothetical protein
MPLFDRPPIDAISVSNALFSSGTFRITGDGANITVASDASGAIISGGGGAQLSYYDNMVPNGLASPLTQQAISYNTLILSPLDPSNEMFAGNMTVSTMLMQMSQSAQTTATASTAYSSTIDIGIYTRPNGTALSLANSARSSWAAAANTSASRMVHGLRWLSIHSSQWSSSPAFTAGRYYVGVLMRSAGTSHNASAMGQVHMGSNLRSGTVNVSASTGNTGMGAFPLMGLLSVSTASLPASVAASAVNQAVVGAGFIPALAFNNLTSSF